MQEHHDEIVRLLFKLVNDEQLYPDEQQVLDNWIAQSPHNKQVFDDVTNEQLLEQEVNGLVGYDQKYLWRQIHRGINGQPHESRLLYFFRTLTGRVAAVAVLVLLGIGVYIALDSSSPSKVAGVKTNRSFNTASNPAKEDIVRELADAAAMALNNASNDMINEDPAFYNTPSSYNKRPTTDKEQYGNSVACLDPFCSKRPGLNGIERGIAFAGEAVSQQEEESVVMETGVPGTEFNTNSYTDEGGRRWVLNQNSPIKKRSNKIITLPRASQDKNEQRVNNYIDMDNVMYAKDECLFPLD
jgi:hypothetical protein